MAHSSDNPHVDVFVRISEVDAKGRSRNVSDGYRRLDGTRRPHVSLELDAIAHRFRAGTRIRVLIAGGSHPRYARNLGTGEATVTGSQLKPSTHEVHFGTSRVVLPVGLLMDIFDEWRSGGTEIHWRSSTAANDGAEVTVFTRRCGTPGAPALVCVHGFPTASIDYFALTRELDADFDISCWTSPATGSPKSRPRLTCIRSTTMRAC